VTLSAIAGQTKAKKARGLSRALRRNQEPWWCLKVYLVLPSPLVGGIFFDRLFLGAAEGPFFDRFFFLWFGSHRPITYNNLNKISPILFYEHSGSTASRNG
jgi:hypothetical protein